jgi:GNAT superfamily N-acetyltransferase
MKNYIKQLLRENLDGVQYIYHGDVEDDDAYDRYEIEANAMAKSHGIGLGSNGLAYITLMGDKLIGATWIGVAGVFSFDIVVDSAYQSKGIGSRLIDMVMNKYGARVKIAGDNYGIRVNVVNDNLKSYLISKYNLVEDKNESNILVNK